MIDSKSVDMYRYLGVTWRNILITSIIFFIRMGGVGVDKVDVTRYDEREHLFAGPERLGFQDGGLRNFSIPTGKPHQKVHDIGLHV